MYNKEWRQGRRRLQIILLKSCMKMKTVAGEGIDDPVGAGGVLMNGEMHQICMLVSEARNAMAGKMSLNT